MYIAAVKTLESNKIFPVVRVRTAKWKLGIRI